MRHIRQRSITTQICMVIIGLVTGTVLLCWFLNTTFLEQYYSRMKTDQLVSGYDTVNWAAKHDKLSDSEIDVQLDRMCDNGNIELLIISSDGTVVRSTSNDSLNLINRFMDVLFGAASDKGRQEVVSTDSYSVLLVTDRRMSSEYLVLWGTLEDGNLVMMRTALESIRESVSIANRFLAYIGICGILLSAVIVVFVTRRITRPIRQLTDISRQMTELDFTAKYEEGSSIKEIEQLGMHMNQLSETLERAIGELKTANNQLKRDIRKKEEIDEMRKEFLANVSHELKTPIALIQGYAEGLTEGISEDPESRKFYCDVISDEAAKMNQMVQKLLTLNQLEFGNNTLNLERFDLTALIGNYIQSAGILIEKNEIQVQVEETGAIYAWGDEFAVEEVFANYFTNAVNHCSGDKQIVVKFQERENKVRVSVFNTGDSIPEEALSRLWEKFYKVDKARTREYGGSGVGLSIVKAIMESMHQEYGVENYANGVLFWFELERA